MAHVFDISIIVWYIGTEANIGATLGRRRSCDQSTYRRRPGGATIFHEDGALDLPGLRRVVDYLVDAEVDGMCALANYSEQFSLTDAERDEVAATVLEQVAGRVPVILTTSHFSTRIAVQRSRDAQRMGAAVVMLMPPFFGATLSVSGPDVVGFFAEVAAAIDIPIMVQDAPMSTTPLSAALLVDLVTRVSSVRYAKIEVPFAADKLAALVGALGDRLPGPFDGEESVTLIRTWTPARWAPCAARWSRELGRIVRGYLAGDRTPRWPAGRRCFH